MISKTSAGLVILSLALAGPALAQDGDPALPPATNPQDPGNWQPKNPTQPPLLPSNPAQPSPVNPAVPGQPAPAPIAPGQPAPAPVKKTYSPEEQARRDKAIQKNYEGAEKILRNVLDDKDADYNTVKTRVLNLRNIVRTYSERRGRYEAQKRRLQVDLFNRTLFYQKQYEAGKIPKKVYDQKVKEEQRKYRDERASIDSQLKFSLAEENRARATLTTQEAKLKLMEAERPILKIGKPKPKPKPDPGLLLKQRLRSLGAFKPKCSLGNERLNRP